jgi:membrane protein DedA with SNARE-associated domain
MEGVMEWLTQLPRPLLYGAMFLLAGLENVFPPLPADVLVAFGAFIAARSGSSPIPSYLAVLLGNVTGALGMYALGRRFGEEWVKKKLHLHAGPNAEGRLLSLYGRWGMTALFLSRFVPGVRSIVPPFAGALKIPFWGTLLAISLASGLFYGLITALAFQAGSNWETLVSLIKRLGSVTAIVAVVLLAIIAGVFYLRRRKRRAASPMPEERGV